MTKPAVFSILATAAEAYQAKGKWWMDILLAMPDHLHAMASFPEVGSMGSVIRDWKRFVAKRAGVVWQAGFFDHRLRSHELASATWRYIVLNPVRKGLIGEPDDWPYVWIGHDKPAR